MAKRGPKPRPKPRDTPWPKGKPRPFPVDPDVDAWIGECCCTAGTAPMAQLLTSWRRWCDRHGRDPGKHGHLGFQLTLRGYPRSHGWKGEKRHGLALAERPDHVA
jgi:hypothetical protein